MYARQMIFSIAVVALMTNTQAASAQVYAIDWHTTDGGGGLSIGGTFQLFGTIGQTDAGFATGGTYTLSGGFHFPSSGGGTLGAPGVGDGLCAGGSNSGSPCSTNDDCPGGTCSLKSRYITVDAGAGGALRGGSMTSIQVTIVSMLLFPEREGEVWWAGPSQAIPNSPHPSALGAGLACAAIPTNAESWPAGPLHLFGSAIIPGSRYQVRLCDDTGGSCSDPLDVATGKWGDVVEPFGGGSQPNLGDVNAVVSKFQGNPSAPNAPAADLRGLGATGAPNIVNQIIDLADVNSGVQAFQGFPFPYSVPACP